MDFPFLQDRQGDEFNTYGASWPCLGKLYGLKELAVTEDDRAQVIDGAWFGDVGISAPEIYIDWDDEDEFPSVKFESGEEFRMKARFTDLLDHLLSLADDVGKEAEFLRAMKRAHDEFMKNRITQQKTLDEGNSQ